MSRQLLGAVVLGLVLSACSSSPLDPSSGQGTTEEATGSVSLPLTATVGDVTYRLRNATFTITGDALEGKPRVVKPLPDVAVHNEPLPVGSYSILLEKGWVLEKKTSAEKVYTTLAAQLVTPNPLTFDVSGKVPADAFFGFATVSGEVGLGQGSVNIRIGVQDCSAYDAYTASLGALTVDCLGAIGPDDYTVSRDGILSPSFTGCPADPSKLQPIRQLLSLQSRSVRLPFVKQCIAGRYAAWQGKFAQTGVVACPAWKKDRIVNPINDDVIGRVTELLPKLPAKDTGQPLGFLGLLKENSLYTVGFPQTPPAQKCETPAACAAVCAGGFPGFVISTDGATVMTDPPAWLLDNTYPLSAKDPFLRPGYYHPMSYYGGAPGVQFGEYSRFQPCLDGSCTAEACSYFAGIHLQTSLQPDCLDYGNTDTCVSFCGPPL
jgi:hypothetical protein